MKRRISLTKTQREVIFQKTEGHCHVCGYKIEGKWAADHVVPHAVGRKFEIDNFLPCCYECNRLRWFYSPEELKKILRLGVYCNGEIKRGTVLGTKINNFFLMKEESIPLKKKTLEDFINETTFELQEIETYSSTAYYQKNPIKEGLNDIIKMIEIIFDKGENPENFWSFATSLLHLYTTFEVHKEQKVNLIDRSFDKILELREQIILEASIPPIYYSGNKLAQYMKENRKDNIPNKEEGEFLRKYAGTRNKIIEHTLEPYGYEFIIRPHFTTCLSTDPYIQVDLEKQGEESIKVGRINYYQDNYRLLNICIRYLKCILE